MYQYLVAGRALVRTYSCGVLLKKATTTTQQTQASRWDFRPSATLPDTSAYVCINGQG